MVSAQPGYSEAWATHLDLLQFSVYREISWVGFSETLLTQKHKSD